MEENMNYRYRLRLETLSDVKAFVDIVSKYDGDIILTDGQNYVVNAKSVLGAMYSIEWNELYVSSDIDIYTQIRQFTI